MSKRRILLLDCTRRSEPSEGQLLSRFFDICKLYKPKRASAIYCHVRSKKEFLSKLDTGRRYDVIHISGHGPPKGSKEVWLGNGRSWKALPEEIKRTSHRAKLIFANACVNDRKAMAEAFKGAKYFLAPSSEVYWIDAAMFSLMFYKRHIVDGVGMRNAFRYARKHTHTGKDYQSYWE